MVGVQTDITRQKAAERELEQVNVRFRLALEAAPAGSVLHAVGDEGVPIRAVAEIVASRLGVPAVSVAPEQAGEYLGFLGAFWGFDGPASAQLTRDLLGWQPTRPGLIADLEEGHYFA